MRLTPPSGITVRKLKIKTTTNTIPALALYPETYSETASQPAQSSGVLWIHGGGYICGMKEMVFMSRAVDLVRKYGAVVVSPGYRLAFRKPYPAALEDCYAALVYMKEHAEELGICKNQIFVGGESAGGGLAAAVCMAARDRGTINIAYQMPLYPMLDDRDTPSSADNHGRIWNTRKNHKAWRMYLKGLGRKPGDSSVPVYAAPARQTDYSGLPPAYTFVGDGEPFYAETLDYIANLKRCGIQAEADVYHCDMHAFDMMRPEWELSCEAAQRFNEHFEYAMKNYYAKN